MQTPEAQTFFIENVDSFMANQLSADAVLEKLQSQYRQMKSIESRLLEQKEMIKYKIPEIKQSLDIINQLKQNHNNKQSTTTHYELTSRVWAEAEIKPETQSVFLWLGANVMVEYPFGEAVELLTNNLESGKKSLEKITTELDNLKESITVAEVNIARVFNWDVRERRKVKGNK